MAGVSYAAPWWVNLLHRLPHFSLRWEPTSSQFRPEDPDYQQVTWAPGRGSRVGGQGAGSRPFPSKVGRLPSPICGHGPSPSRVGAPPRRSLPPPF